LEHRRKGLAIIRSYAFIPRFSASGEHERGERDGVAVTHLAARRRGRHIDEFVAGANDGDSRTSKHPDSRLAGESQERQLSRGQDLAFSDEFIAAAEVFAGGKN
jgi:hypothetical protein